MLLTMRRIALVLTCFAAASQGRRVQTAVKESQSSEAFAALLLSLDPAAAFKPSDFQGFGHLGRSGLASSRARQILRATLAMSTIGVKVQDPPTTLLGGFLGAGKTTSLTHMLTNRKGLKIAVLVNDVAAVNVDAATMRRRTIEIDGVEMLELKNGCICCGQAGGELPAQVRSLSTKREKDGSATFDHVVVELSGVADPKYVEKNLRAQNLGVERKVALVDANLFPALYNSESRIGDRADLVGEDAVQSPNPCSVDKKVIKLLLAQIESADVILVNKCDLASDDELQTTLTACRALNSEAEIVSTTFGDAKLEEMLPLAVSSNEVTPKEGSKPDFIGDPFFFNPDVAKLGAAPNQCESIGFQTFVYRARRPFSQERLVSLMSRWPMPRKKILSLENILSPGADGSVKGEEAVDTTFANVLRSKGTAWLQSEHNGAVEWSQAGRHLTLTAGSAWWALLPPEIMRAALSTSRQDTTEESEAYKAERANFAGEFGDRRQEIVFIGADLDTDKIERALDKCLLTDKEMEQYVMTCTPGEQRRADANGPFRFDVGTKVECNMGDHWESGIVVKQYYREAEWPSHQWAPYQVRLDNDEVIFAPADIDSVIRRVGPTNPIQRVAKMWPGRK